MKKILALLFFLFFFFKPQNVFAEIIHSFDVDLTVHKDGSMDFVETINYDFENEYRHGIYRYIPLYSKVGDLYRIIKIKNAKVLRDGQSEKFTTTQTKEQIYFKIGDADETINGPHIYKIFYTVENGIGSNYEDHDEIYWNATGNNWEVIIEKASIQFNTDFGVNPNNLICFTGQTGSKESLCEVSENKIFSSMPLYPYSGLTAVAGFSVNSFPKSILAKQLPKNVGEKIAELIFRNYYLIFIFFNFILGGYLIYWYQKHKNKKRFGPPSVNFDIPKDEKSNRLEPALAGTIDTAKLERDDVVATIFDLAIRKYIRLEEIKTIKSLAPDKVEQKIIKLKNDDGKLTSFEKTLFDRLFKTGNEIKVSDLKLDFYKTFEDMETDVFKNLVNKKYYIKNPKNQKALFAIFGVLALVTGNIILSIILFSLSSKLNGRTALGDEIDFKIDGLKLFLKSMDRNYKWQAEKFYTVEQMIPYSMALGYIDKFMEALKIIKPDYNPSWYHGYSGNFYTSYAAFSAATSNNLTTSAPSSSSGFSGGSSGGGGGGGGGGSW
ncbi:MAG: hypothetical protein A2171_01300 [Candidatus Levybacteria bacterium RBG_13_35_9]|nr:MAG: hypothetical protein A2171_01300 [Candidatus Levybacteria bacterium RBG_13_35_9]